MNKELANFYNLLFTSSLCTKLLNHTMKVYINFFNIILNNLFFWKNPEYKTGLLKIHKMFNPNLHPENNEEPKISPKTTSKFSFKIGTRDKK